MIALTILDKIRQRLAWSDVLQQTMEEIRQTVAVIVGQATDLFSALVDLFLTSMISLPASALIGIIVISFLLGVLLGRISKRDIPEALEKSEGREADRIVLDLERLTPLGLSAEEEAETEAMDISALRPGETIEGTSQGDLHRRHRPETGPQR